MRGRWPRRSRRSVPSPASERNPAPSPPRRPGIVPRHAAHLEVDACTAQPAGLRGPCPATAASACPSNFRRGREQHRRRATPRPAAAARRVDSPGARAASQPRARPAARHGRGSRCRSRTKRRTGPRSVARSHSTRHSFPPFFQRSLSCAGFALPPVAFMTWPTKKPNSLSLPRAVIGELARVLRHHLVDGLLDGAGVGDLLEALRLR